VNASTRTSVPTPQVTLVTSPSCHLCADAEVVLREREVSGQLDLTVIEMLSPAGQELVSAHRPSMFPMVLVNGHVLGFGRLSRGQLDRALAGAR